VDDETTRSQKAEVGGDGTREQAGERLSAPINPDRYGSFVFCCNGDRFSSPTHSKMIAVHDCYCSSWWTCFVIFIFSWIFIFILNSFYQNQRFTYFIPEKDNWKNFQRKLIAQQAKIARTNKGDDLTLENKGLQSFLFAHLSLLEHLFWWVQYKHKKWVRINKFKQRARKILTKLSHEKANHFDFCLLSNKQPELLLVWD